MSKVAINLGCGDNPLPECINCDIRTGDVRLNALHLPFRSASVDWIECHHLFEHLDNWEAREALTEWYRVLKPGGKLFLTVPDLPQIMRFALSLVDIPEAWRAWIIPIYGAQQHPYDYHKSGYSTVYLLALLSLYGFDGEQVTGDDLPQRSTPNLGVIATRRYQ